MEICLFSLNGCGSLAVFIKVIQFQKNFYGVFNSSKKRTKKTVKIHPNSTMIPKVGFFFVCFLEEFQIPKSPFEIN